ncbi:carboxypeptidase regulatory-like domain-containing protein [Nocardioides nitrophenolicus]|uniref:carboxypeptidase regulatory-like domain-containing protein n=1 Tax=Nocardioides nitrophenolicus TaxID=60489 RepID=UPI0019568B25|nr:carboxypeptidase regulatory-like domain-containing protein [Nocardioides nitrophenolicus]MBM7518851.1 hypothetical protein [Nocardioides nitrophenolicus]
MKPRHLLLPALVLGLLAPVGSVPASAAAARAPITGRVVDDHGAPVAGVEVTLFRAGHRAADNDGSTTGPDGRFVLRPGDYTKGGSFAVLISTGEGTSTALPTWYDGSGADGGIRASVLGETLTTEMTRTDAPPPAGARLVRFGKAARDLGDLATPQGTRVSFESKDTKGRQVSHGVLAHDAVSNTVREAAESYQTYLLEPGRQTVTLTASRYVAGGSQQLTLDLVAGTTQKVPVTWAAQYYLSRVDRMLDGGVGLIEVPGQRLSVGDRIWVDAWFANDSALTFGVTSYQWYRDATPIPGATGRSYRVATADRGHQVSYQVTLAPQADYAGVSYRSTPDPVAAVTAKVRARFPKGDVSMAHPERYAIRVRVSQSNGKRPVGRLALIVENIEPEIPPKVIVARAVRRTGPTSFVLRLPRGFDAQRYDEYGAMYVRFVPKNRAKVSVASSRGQSIYVY